MVPNDLAGFSVEQLKGFAVANRLEYDSVKTGDLDDAARVASLESLLNDRDRWNAAIEAALAAEEAAAEDTQPEGDEAAEAAEGDDAAEDSDADGEDAETAEVGDADAAVDDAVASAAMGGGRAPSIRVTRDEADKASGSMRKFVRNMITGNVSREERHSFSTMRRETNHIVREGQNANDAIQAAILSRLDGSDKTAAGCFCGPDDAITAIKECGETIRPLSDTLPTLTASGDVKYVRQIDLADALTGVTEWTCADQDNVDPEVISTWKPCFELECEPEITSALYAVAACASFTTQQLIGNPQLVANLEHVMRVAYSKTAELLVYNRLKALSSQYSFGYALTAYGAGAQLLVVVGWFMEKVRANLREANPQYTLTIPAGLKERIITDGFLTGARSPDETWGRILERLRELGVTRVVELVDEITGVPLPLAHTAFVAPGGPIAVGDPHPVVQEIALYRPEDFLLGVAPEIDLGVTRSPELARQNKLQWSVESFEFVEKPGCAPAATIQAPFCASGVRPALGTGEDCTA